MWLYKYIYRIRYQQGFAGVKFSQVFIHPAHVHDTALGQSNCGTVSNLCQDARIASHRIASHRIEFNNPNIWKQSRAPAQFLVQLEIPESLSSIGCAVPCSKCTRPLAPECVTIYPEIESNFRWILEKSVPPAWSGWFRIRPWQSCVRRKTRDPRR